MDIYDDERFVVPWRSDAALFLLPYCRQTYAESKYTFFISKYENIQIHLTDISDRRQLHEVILELFLIP